MQLKTSTLFFTLLLTANFTYGQSKMVNSTPQKVLRNTFKIKADAQQRFAPADTIGPLIIGDTCSLTVFNFFNNDGWGFVGGMNDFGDLEKAQRFVYNQENYEIQEILLFIATAEVVGDGNVRVKIYDVDNSTEEKGPSTLIGTSDPLKVSELQLDDEFLVFTTFTFSEPAQVTGSEFFVSVDFSELYETQDTVALFMTDIACGEDFDSWELFSDGESWVPLSSANSWGIKSNFYIFATVQDLSTSTQELSKGKNRIRLHDAFPNPANQELTISYDLQSSTDLQIELYSIDGKLLQRLDKSAQTAGQHQEIISTQHLPAGMYLYGIVTNEGQLMNKFVVEK